MYILLKNNKQDMEISGNTRNEEIHYLLKENNRVSQVLPPDRKHPLLIDLKLSKNSGMILY
jgi:hypothetical protein